MRKRGSSTKGISFDEETIEAVWKKGQVIFGQDSRYIRKDSCGAIIMREKHGDTDSKYGWEIDHNKPVSKGGSDHISNLYPLQWQNNRHKSDTYPLWYCFVRVA